MLTRTHSKKNIHSLLVEQPLWKTVWHFLIKLTLLLPYDPTITLFGIYPKEMKTQVHTKTCTWMFIAALYIIAKMWKQYCPSVGAQINKWWSIQTITYDSVLETNKLANHEKTWQNLKCILLSEKSQSEHAPYCRIPIAWYLGRGKTLETITRLVVGNGGRDGQRIGWTKRILRAVKIICMI